MRAHTASGGGATERGREMVRALRDTFGDSVSRCVVQDVVDGDGRVEFSPVFSPDGAPPLRDQVRESSAR